MMTFEEDSHRAVRGVSAAEVRARPRAEVGVIPFGLVDPPPAQILPEVDVQRPNAAVLLVVPESRRKQSLPPPVRSHPHALWLLHSFRDVSMHFSLGCFGDFYFGSVWAYKHVRQSFEAQKFHCEVCHFFPPGSDPGVEC